MLTPKSPWKNKDEREKKKHAPAGPGAVISGGKVTGAAKAPTSTPRTSAPKTSAPKASAPAGVPLGRSGPAGKPASKSASTSGSLSAGAAGNPQPKKGAAGPFKLDRPLGPNFGTNDPKDMKKLRAATTAAGLTPPWVAGSALDKDDEQPETFKAVAEVNRKAGGHKAGAFGAIVTPGGKAESEINKALDKAPDGPARFARLMNGDDPKAVMTPPKTGGIKDAKKDPGKPEGASGGKAGGKPPERTPPERTLPERTPAMSTRQETQPDSRPEGDEATPPAPTAPTGPKPGAGQPDTGQARRQRLQDLTAGIAALESRMKRAETRREESALIREASRLHAKRERLAATQESPAPEPEAPDAPAPAARRTGEGDGSQADDKESRAGEPLPMNASEQPGALLAEPPSSSSSDANGDFETAFSKIAARLRASTADDRADRPGGATPPLSPQFVSTASESGPAIVDDKFYDTVERTYRAYVDFAKEKGMELTARHLERYLEGTGEPITYDRETARSIVAVAKGEALNRKRFEEDVADPDSKLRKFLRRPEPSDSDRFKDHYDFEFGALPIRGIWEDLSPLERALLFTAPVPFVIAGGVEKGRSHVLSGDLDAGFGIGSGEVKSLLSVTETREGNRIILKGEITHRWSDTYDFAPGGDFAAGALALEEAGRATPFEFGTTWKQRVVMVIEEDNGEYTLLNITWTDIAEGAEDE